MIKDINEEVHRVRFKRVPSTGASVSVKLGGAPLLEMDVFIIMEAPHISLSKSFCRTLSCVLATPSLFLEVWGTVLSILGLFGGQPFLRLSRGPTLSPLISINAGAAKRGLL